MRTSFPAFAVLASILAVPTLASSAHADEMPMLAPTQGLAFETAPADVEAPRETEWNSPALAVTGSVVAGLGLVATIAGAAMYAGDPCTSGENVTQGVLGMPECGMGMGQAMGGITMLGGGALMLIGTPMIVAGAWQVESDDRGVPPTTAEVHVGPARADLAVTF